METSEIWLPLAQNPLRGRGRAVRVLDVMAKIKPAITVDQAQSNLHEIAKDLQRAFPATNTDFDFAVEPLLERFVGKVRTPLLLLLGAVGVLLIIACANIANLFLIRGLDRQKEVTLRTALGCPQWKIIRQFLLETVAVALIGGVFGLVIAASVIRSLPTIAPTLPRLYEVRLDLLSVAYIFVIAFIAGSASGVVPALAASNTNLNESLKENTPTAGLGASRKRTRFALAALETALACMLLITSVLLMRSFVKVLQVDPGYRTDHLIAVLMPMSTTKYRTSAERFSVF